jgi:hypothetical protein
VTRNGTWAATGYAQFTLDRNDYVTIMTHTAPTVLDAPSAKPTTARVHR